MDLAQLNDAVFVLVAPNEDILGRGRAGMETRAFERGNAGADVDLGRDSGIHAKPADEVLGGIRIPSRIGSIPEWIAVHHGELRAQEAPGSLGACPQVEGAGKERAADVAAFEKVPIGIPFLDFQSEGNTNKSKTQDDTPPRPLSSEHGLRPCQAGGHAFDRVHVHFDDALEVAPAGVDEEVRAPDEEALAIERLASGRRELILCGLVKQHAIGLDKPSER